MVCILSYGQRPESIELGELYESGKYEETINKALEYLEKEPEYITFHLVLGRAYTDIYEYQKAIPHLKFTVENDSLNSWKKGWALSYLGTCYYMQSDYENSEKALISCIELKTTKNVTKDAYNKMLTFGYDKSYINWKIVESENIRFHFRNMSETEIQKYIKTREEAFTKINEFFGSTLPKNIDFFVWDSRKKATKILHRNLGFAEPTYCIIHSHFQQTKGHELTHIISNYSTNVTTKTGLINEGISVHFDLSNRNDEQKVINLIKNKDIQIDIKKIWSNWQDYPQELTYPLSGLLVGKLIEVFGKEKFLLFFADQTYENAKTIFGDELDIFIEEFENKWNKK